MIFIAQRGESHINVWWTKNLMWQREFYIQWTIQCIHQSSRQYLLSSYYVLKWYEHLETGLYGTYNEWNKLVTKNPEHKWILVMHCKKIFWKRKSVLEIIIQFRVVLHKYMLKEVMLSGLNRWLDSMIKSIGGPVTDLLQQQVYEDWNNTKEIDMASVQE